MIKLRNISKTFFKNGNKIEVLKGLNLDIARGESIAIWGVSGAGKSTLLHVLGTLDHPTSGTLLYDDMNVFAWQEKKLAVFRNRKIGFVFQFHNLLPEFNSLENTMMPALINGLSKHEARERAEVILNELGLGDRITHRPGELSGGEQQRVAIARALIMEPEILLADEPIGNLDTQTGKKIEDILLELNITKHIILVVVTHNKSLADRMSRSIGLRDGKIVTDE
ncbi:MAG: ABC transporter ATP-binding protein [Syntrophaceae bacterium CG2_30_49_12]|nr:MAG: ABC transporter ATP-binding protein [Syntrophaceae bacterium CG2_30_49_12]PIP05550.1 MAG: lipoprotein-releasing system ATP-binding protein LolD [Syntrophobacterales bacterium CG23_combo_of_CG06-09_8_20_14_all_48_27]PJC73421.1 MAG: lipoprotein-releasing system ATP-binding protein LolD [Syntrophobacterales bacterium CG_4_8_14_3_um_filter_49_14]